jgi:predicted Rossmann fold nucleotide-binding protein DprA/Smf involved in DNA uptake
VIVEAGPASGARILARRAAGLDRPVLLLRSLIEREPWARELVAHGAAAPLDDVDDVLRALESAREGREPPAEQLSL